MQNEIFIYIKIRRVDCWHVFDFMGTWHHICMPIADDTQVSSTCRPSNVGAFSSSISDCQRNVASWMKSNSLQLNSSKTEVMWCATSRRQHILTASACETWDFMGLHCVIWVRLSVCLIYRIGVVSAVITCCAIIQTIHYWQQNI